MFYAKNSEEQDKNFQIKETWDNKKPQQKPPAATRQKPDSLLKDVGVKAVTPQITHDILDQHMANGLLKDLGLHVQPKSQDSQIEQYLNQNKFRGESPQQKKGSQKQSQDNEIVTSMASRLQKLEKLCNAQKLELREKSQLLIDSLEQVEQYKKYSKSDQLIEELEKVKLENKSLQLKVQDMEKFLLSYGIKWVGDDQGKKDADKKMKQLVQDLSQPKPLFNYHLPDEISIDVILRRVEELNYIMEKEGATQVVKNQQGMHQLKKMDQLPIGFYRNGIAMKGFKFFAYGSNDAYQILADIMDGYFPYQLKVQFPNGTLLKVIDKTDEVFDSEKLNQKQVDIHQFDERQLKPQSKEEFLSKLPNQVIKNGKIIPIRSEIAKKFDKQMSTTIDQPKDEYKVDQQDGSIIILTDAQKKLDQGSPYDPEDMCTLKFRTETGKYTLIAVMYCSQSVSELYDIVGGYRENQGKQFEMILNFPRTVFDVNSKQSLVDAGLHPNAQLFFK